MTAGLAGIFVGLALLLAVPRPARLATTRWRAQNWFWSTQLLVGITGAYVLFALNVSALLIVVVLGVAGAVVRAIRSRHRRAVVATRRARVLDACEGLAGDLEAGIAPHQALNAMAEDWPELRPVADAGTVGADVPTAFRSVAELPGAEMLRVTAAAWSVAERSGAGLAGAMQMAASSLRAERSTARTVATEMAAALATARLLAVLPIGILLIGRGAGGDPFGFLLGTLAGQICLVCGAALSWAGSMWLERIGDRVTRS
jgi:tight adherence protein B